MRMELSLSVSRTVEYTANGPLKSKRTASCGRYVKVNMAAMTETVSVP